MKPNKCKGVFNINTEMKSCSICNEVKSLSEFYSQKKHSKKRGDWVYHNPECKECSKEKAKGWNKENRDKRLIILNKNNKTDKSRQSRRLYSKKKRENGKYKEWQYKNPDKIKEYGEKRKNKNHIISKKEWESCKMYFNNACAYCSISYEQHKEIHKQDLHKEHVDDEGSNYLENCIPSCKTCNSSKHTFSFDEWYIPSNSVYSDERKNKIIKWLMDDYKLYFEGYREKGSYNKNKINS